MRDAFKSFAERLGPPIAILRDREVDDELLRHLLDSLMFTRDTLAASSAMGVLATLLVWAATHSPLCALFLLVNLAIGLGRWRLVRAYGRCRNRVLRREELNAFDRGYLALSVSFAAGIGVMCAFVALGHSENGESVIAMAVTVGYSVAFCQRSAGRMRLLIGQIVAMCLPMMIAYALNGRQFAGTVEIMLAALLVTALILGFSAHRQIVALHRADSKTRRMAHSDMLTGLMNRYAFYEMLDAEIAAHAAGAPGFALMLVDLDRFKEINDSHGHIAGDAVLVEMAARLRAKAPAGARIARLGGDEFIIFVAETGGHGPALAWAWALVQALKAPVRIDDIVSPVGASLGLVLFPEHAATRLDLMKTADLALYEAKRQGRGRAVMFDARLQSRFEENRACELAIAEAVERSEFEPWLQPIVDLETGAVLGYEALARWRRGDIWEPPAKFIPLAEENGAIEAIGEQILAKACVAAASWSAPHFVAVNLSPVQFRRPRRLLAAVRDALAHSGLPPRRLHLEITETLMLEDNLVARAVLEELAAQGVALSLDDFGAGYSSLSYIQSYPFSTIKIDKSFVDRIETSRESEAIVAAVRALANRLDLELIAEGVERPEQDRALRALGVRLGQGYLYGAPAPAPLAAPVFIARAAG